MFLGEFDWEEEHERLAEVAEPHKKGDPIKGSDSGYGANERSYRSQEVCTKVTACYP